MQPPTYTLRFGEKSFEVRGSDVEVFHRWRGYGKEVVVLRPTYEPFVGNLWAVNMTPWMRNPFYVMPTIGSWRTFVNGRKSNARRYTINHGREFLKLSLWESVRWVQSFLKTMKAYATTAT